MWARGDRVVLRGLVHGRVRWAFGHTVVADSADLVALLIRPGTAGKWVRRDVSGQYIDRWVTNSAPDDHVWTENRVLWLARPGEAYSIGVFWEHRTDELRGWYVQLQAPLRRSRLGFDTTDHALDIWIAADGSWSWKDEDDLAKALELGAFTPAEAAAIRAEGERVLEEWPFPTGWESFRPDPVWAVPGLPRGWEVV